MRIYIPSKSRSDRRNTDALALAAVEAGHTVAHTSRKHHGPESDVAIILGDRHEMLAVAHDCLTHHAPYVHVGAGCETAGSWDNSFRHMLTSGSAARWAYTDRALTVMEHYDRYGWSLNQGECRGHGVPILDTLKPRGLKRQDYVLVAINPVTAHNVGEELGIVDEIADACEAQKLSVLWSTPNEDPQSEKLYRKMCERFSTCWELRNNSKTFADALEECAMIVGNSSSALIEAPVLGTPFVDCGCRQDGRPLAMGLRGIAIGNAMGKIIRGGYKFPFASPYQHPERRACQEIIRLCEEVGNG